MNFPHKILRINFDAVLIFPDAVAASNIKSFTDHRLVSHSHCPSISIALTHGAVVEVMPIKTIIVIVDGMIDGGVERFDCGAASFINFAVLALNVYGSRGTSRYAADRYIPICIRIVVGAIHFYTHIRNVMYLVRNGGINRYGSAHIYI